MDINNEDIKPSISWVKSELIEQRIDSQFYKNEFINNEIKIKKVNNILLKDMYYRGDYGTLPDSSDYCNDGIYLVRGTDLRELSIDEDNLIVVPKEYFNEKSEVKPEDILMLIKGATIDAKWSVSIAPQNSHKSIFNGSIFRIRVKNEYDPYYLTAFMSTKYFLRQKRRAISNTGIFYNDKESIEKFVIPVSSPEIQKYIGDKIRKAEKLREEAKKMKKEAEEMLENSINIDMSFLDKNEKKYTWVNRDRIDDGNITGDYYKEIYMEIEKRIDISQLKFMNLGEVTKDILLGNTKKVSDYYCNEGIPYITTKNIKREGIDFSALLFIPESKHNNDLKKSKAFPNDILYNKSGNVGLSSLLTDEYKEYNVVSDIIIIRPDIERINAYYLVLFLNSKLGKNMSERMAGGAIFQHISIYDIAKIKVPMLPFEIQTAIGEKKMKSELYSKKSQKLIDEAKQDIEDLIEGNFDMSKIKETN